MSAQSFDDHKIAVTFFPSHTAKTKTSESLTLPELGDKILQMTKPGKKRLPWLKLAVFGDARTEAGALRHDDNVLSITGGEVDYDTCRITFDEAVERLWAAGVRAIVYTSPSYQKGVAEKWRVLCPTSEPLPPERRYELVAALHGLLGEGIDPVSFTLSQSYYYGSVNSNPDHRVEALDGDFIDLRPDLLSAAVGGRRLSSAKHRQQIKIYCKQMPARPTRTRRSIDCSIGRSTKTATARATGTPTCWQ